MKLMFGILSLIVLSVACTSKDELKKILKENPDIITETIQAHPEKFIDALNSAVKAAQEGQGKKREEEEKKALEESFNNPIMAEIRDDEIIRGSKDAPITLIEFSDFECPFCSRGYGTVMELLKKYEGKIKFVYKHLPLSFHPMAMPAARYFDAIKLQSSEKAWEFHDRIYKDQKKLQNGDGFLKSLAKELKVDMKKLEKDLKSEDIDKHIEHDMSQASKYGFQGTPGFLLNGIPVKGAYPTSHFVNLIEELQKRGKLSL